jgi:hypothetical protein
VEEVGVSLGSRVNKEGMCEEERRREVMNERETRKRKRRRLGVQA